MPNTKFNYLFRKNKRKRFKIVVVCWVLFLCKVKIVYLQPCFTFLSMGGLDSLCLQVNLNF